MRPRTETVTIGEITRALTAGVSVNSDTGEPPGEGKAAVLKTSCIARGRFYPSESKGISGLERARARLNPRRDTIIVSRMNTPHLVGECGYVDRDWPNLFLPDRLWLLELRAEFRDATYLVSQELSSERVRQQLKSAATGTSGSMKNLSREAFLQVELRVPDKRTRDIAGRVVSDAARSWEALDQLIAKKEAVKQGVMQQLLAGQTRLPGFNKPWKPHRLAEVGTWQSGGTPSHTVTAFWQGDIPWVSPKDMKTTRLHDAIDHVSMTAIGQGTRLVQQGTILIVVRGMILAHSLPVARAERDLAFNQDIKALVVGPDHDSDFMLWKLLQMKSELMGLITESTHGTKRLSSEALFEIEVLLPPLVEQRAIAEVLTDMDAELEALRARRDKTQALKQGMMQELLSGRIRLV